MPYNAVANFGSASGGLSTVGYTLLKADRTTDVARTTTGVGEIGTGTGTYGAAITLTAITAYIQWDTGGGTPKYATESVAGLQSGDAYAIVNHGTYGNAALLAATQAARLPARLDSGLMIAGYNLARIIEASKTKRVVGIQSQNSNGLHHGYGHDKGIPKGFVTTGIGVWGSGPLSGGGGSVGAGYGGAPGYFNASTGAPSQLAAYIGSSTASTGVNFYNFWDGTGGNGRVDFTVTGSATCGYIKSGQTLRLTVARGVIPGSSRSWKYASRSQYNYATLGTSAAISDAGASYGMTADQFTTSALSANDATAGVEFSAGANYGGLSTPGNAPGFVSYMQVDNPAITSGWAWSTLIARGGQPLKTQASDLLAMTPQQLIHYFQEAWRLADVGRYTLIVISEAFNSQNDGTNSVGPNPAPGNTKAGYKDNDAAMMTYISQVYLLAGGVPGNLAFALVTDHADPGANAALIDAFSAGADELAYASPGVASFKMHKAYTGAELSTLGYHYVPGSDMAHLSTAGYDAIGLKFARELSAAASTAQDDAAVASIGTTALAQVLAAVNADSTQAAARTAATSANTKLGAFTGTGGDDVKTVLTATKAKTELIATNGADSPRVTQSAMDAAAAVAGAGGPVVVLPLALAAVAEMYAVNGVHKLNLSCLEGEAPSYIFAVTDSLAVPVTLTGRTLRFVVWDANYAELIVAEGAALQLIGTTAVRVNLTAAQTTGRRDITGQWALWDLDSDKALGRGAFRIAGAVKDVA